MAKTPKIKKRPVSANSRAARRANSDVIEVDSSITSTRTLRDPAGVDQSIISARSNRGVMKAKKGRPLKKQQRLRREKAMEKAFAVSSRLANKVTKSKSKGKLIKDRSATWEDLNEAISAKTESKKLVSRDAGFKSKEGKEIENTMLEETMDDVEEEPDPRLAIVHQNPAWQFQKRYDEELNEIS